MRYSYKMASSIYIEQALAGFDLLPRQTKIDFIHLLLDRLEGKPTDEKSSSKPSTTTTHFNFSESEGDVFWSVYDASPDLIGCLENTANEARDADWMQRLIKTRRFSSDIIDIDAT